MASLEEMLTEFTIAELYYCGLDWTVIYLHEGHFRLVEARIPNKELFTVDA